MTLTIGGNTVIRGQTTVGGFSPITLFSLGEQGVWYDPSDLTTVFQDSTGTTSATLEQPVGCILDKRNSNYSVYFGGNGKLTLPNTASVNDFGTGDFTIECWVRINDVTSSQIFITCSSSWSASVAYDFEVRNNGDLRFFAGNNVPINISSGNGTLLSNTWHHIAVSRSNGSTKMFVDGVQKGSTHTGNVTISNASSPVIGQFIDGSSALVGYISNLRIVKGTALYTANFTPPTKPITAVPGTTLLTCGSSWSGNPTITRNGDARIDKLNPFNTGTGNHAYQLTDANRPVLSARVNLLTYTEAFDNAAWDNYVSVTPNTAIAPNGAQTADTLTSNGTVNRVSCNVPAVSGVAYLLSVYVKYINNPWIFLQLSDQGVTDRARAWFNIQNGTKGTTAVTGSGAVVSYGIEDAGNGWYRCWLIATNPVTTLFGYFPSLVTDDGVTTVAANGNAAYIWGADLRPANQGVNLPVYQRVGAATYGTSTSSGVADYDAATFPYYLKFDGTNDAMVTPNVDFSSTAKMSIYAGVRKTADGTDEDVIIAVGTTTDVRAVEAKATAYYSSPKGFGIQTSESAGVYSEGHVNNILAPITKVYTATLDRTQSTIATIFTMRLNAVAQTLTQGYLVALSGNFPNKPVYIGARGGSSIYFKGNIYGIIIRGAASTTTEISSVENWLNQKTRAYN